MARRSPSATPVISAIMPSILTPAATTSPSAVLSSLQKVASPPTNVRNGRLRSADSELPTCTAAELTREQLKENVSHQLNEIDMLENIYCQPGEIELSDPLIKEEMNDYIYGRLKVAPIAPQITMRIKCNASGGEDEDNRYDDSNDENDNMHNNSSSVAMGAQHAAAAPMQLLLEISIELPIAYPICASPSIHVRLPRELAPRRQLRFLQRRLNSEVERWVQTWHKLNHETCLLQVLSWLDQNAFSYISTTSSSFSRRLAFQNNSDDDDDDDDASSNSSGNHNVNNIDADEGNDGGDLDDEVAAGEAVVAGRDDGVKLSRSPVDAAASLNSKTLQLHSKHHNITRSTGGHDSDEASSTAAKSPTKTTLSCSFAASSSGVSSAPSPCGTLQPHTGQRLQPSSAAAAASGGTASRRRMRVEDSGCSNGDSSSVNQCGPHDDDAADGDADDDDDDDDEPDGDDEDVIPADDDDDDDEDEDAVFNAVLEACDISQTTTEAAALAPLQIPRSNSLVHDATHTITGRTAKQLAKNLSSVTTAAKSTAQQPTSPSPAATAAAAVIPRSPSLGSRAGLPPSFSARTAAASSSTRSSNSNNGIERRMAFNLNFGARKQPPEKIANEQVVFERLWIHSHHIKAKSKREFLIAKAKELDLSGFTRAGKPGIICVEGRREDCREFWEQCRRLNWQKISLRYEEQHVLTPIRLETSSVDDYRRFRGFREVAFSSRTGGITTADAEHNNTNDADNDDADETTTGRSGSSASSSRMAAFIAWLVEHQSTEAIPYILGFTPSDQYLTMLLASVRNAKKAAAAAEANSKSPKRHHHRRKSSSSEHAEASQKKDAAKDAKEKLHDEKMAQKKTLSAASTSSSSSSSDSKQQVGKKSSTKKSSADVVESPKKTVAPFFRSSDAVVVENATLAAVPSTTESSGRNSSSSSSNDTGNKKGIFSQLRSSLLRPFSDDNGEN